MSEKTKDILGWIVEYISFLHQRFEKPSKLVVGKRTAQEIEHQLRLQDVEFATILNSFGAGIGATPSFRPPKVIDFDKDVLFGLRYEIADWFSEGIMVVAEPEEQRVRDGRWLCD